MRRFYAERIDETTARLPEAESYHARTVLRMKPGDECAAIVGGALYAARLLPDLSTGAAQGRKNGVSRAEMHGGGH